ncbi:hypothetical protein [Nonomuraea typhae]|uniref:hypothetical protein n=1 Tax=Nonomuraea typhae TaxID=2603600 RepID=UPI0012F85131|nr:hypothetical protein [Nonomuraea typhae]
MSGDVLGVLGTVLAALLGGGLITGLLTYLRDRRRDKGEQSIGVVTSLERLNDRLTQQVADLQTALDEERRLRRTLEDKIDEERRARRALEARLEDRMALLERRTEEGEAES